ncbi:hypothetical protein F2Q69_00006391 [Brassica cretica]|uniref:Uncharacterized protein n=1 Tax=Brassica cretica TaxID=69181 RepID=A0A8S9PC19_BRACR|nr:hypothetical protein F2Q69_00006391 [Brassica cretica]
MAVLRSADYHFYSAMIIVVFFVVMPSPTFFARLIPLGRILWGFVRLRWAIGIVDEILDTGDFGDFSCE